MMFNKKLYIEGLRQTFLIGIFMLVVSTIINCFYPINMLIENSSGVYNTYAGMSETQLNQMIDMFNDSPEIEQLLNEKFEEERYSRYYTIEQANLPMLVLIFVLPLVMVFTQFKFLNNRKACDFFHSIPVTRLSLALNFSLAALTWISLCIVIPITISTGLYSTIDYITINNELLIPEILEKVIIAFLVYSSLLIAVSLSGQVITACVISCLVLYLPRFFVTMLVYMVRFNTSFINNGTVSFTDTIGNHLNLLVSKFTSLPDTVLVYKRQPYAISSLEYESFNYNLNSYIYTLILAIVLFVIGCHAFSKRPSEMAGKNTANALTQHIIRILLVVPIMIVTVFIVSSRNTAIGNLNGILFIISVITIIIYFTFELTTTKNIKNLVKSALTLPIVIVFAFAYNGMVSVGTNIALSKANIDVSNVKSVKLDFIGDQFGYNSFLSNLDNMYDEYTIKLISEYDISNEQIIQLVGNILNNNIETIKYENFNIYNKGYVISTTFDNSTKKIEFSREELMEIFDILLVDEYINTTLLSTLPDKSEVVSGNLTSFSTKHYSIEEIQSITDILYEEYNALYLDEQLQVAFHNNYNYFDITENILKFPSTTVDKSNVFSYELSDYGTNNHPTILTLTTKDNITKYIKLNEYLPKTKKFIMDLYIKENELSYSLMEYFVDNYTPSEKLVSLNIVSFDDYYNIHTELYNETGYSSTRQYYVEPQAKVLDMLSSAIQRHNDNIIDYENMYMIYFQPVFKRQGNDKVIYSSNYGFGTNKILLSFTKEEFEDIILNFSDYVTIDTY